MTQDSTLNNAYHEFIDRCVVLDTATPLLYIGRLVGVDEVFITLEDVDVQDGSRSQVAKEVYLAEALTDGVNANRRRVKVKQAAVISLSRLDDIRAF